MTRTLDLDHVYSLDLLITSVALRLGRPVERHQAEKYRGFSQPYVIRDGGTQSVEFWFGAPPDTQTGKERCLFTRSVGSGDHSTEEIHYHTLEQAVSLIVDSPWARMTRL